LGCYPDKGGERLLIADRFRNLFTVKTRIERVNLTKANNVIFVNHVLLERFQDVHFPFTSQNEQQQQQPVLDNNDDSFYDAIEFDESPIELNVEHEEENLSHNNNSQIQEEIADVQEEIADVQEEMNAEEVQTRRSHRNNAGQLPERLNDYVVYMSKDKFEPKTYAQAMSCPDADKWKQAMNEEMQSISENKTWTLTELPKNKKAIGCKWVYKLKFDDQGNVCRYKARLVAQGFSQKYGEDYDEVFAPVARTTTFRILMSVAGMNNYHVKHFDIKTAFLYGEIEEEIYMKQLLILDLNRIILTSVYIAVWQMILFAI